MTTICDNYLLRSQTQTRPTPIVMEEFNSKTATVVLRHKRNSKRGSYMLRMIQNHYTLIEPPKTPQDLSRESWLFPSISIPFNRWFCMPAAFIIQFCVGSIFTWISFDKPIEKFIYGSAAHILTPVTFYIAVALIGISAVVMGPWLERKGSKMASILGGSLFCFGNILVSIALLMKTMWLVYVGYGVSAGYGIGLCFISPVSALQKWFPDHRGLASGISVAGFADGSLINAKLEMLLIQAVELPLTFAILGVAHFMCIFTGALILRTPPPGYVPNRQQQFSMRRLPTISEHLEAKKEWTLLEALGSTDFRLMYVMFFANLLFNLGSTSEWSCLITDVFGKSEEHASNIILMKGCFDLLGRVCFPLLSDYLGRKHTYFLMLTTQLFILISFYFILTFKSYWLFVVSMCIIAACYGGGFETLSVFLVEKFGAVNVGPCFGVMITAWSLAGITGGLSYQFIWVAFAGENGSSDLADPLRYNVTVWVFLSVVVVGWIALLFIQPAERDKQVVRMVKGCAFKRIQVLR